LAEHRNQPLRTGGAEPECHQLRGYPDHQLGNNCVVVAPSFTNGNQPGNEWIEQRIIGANASLFKNIRITEKIQGQVRLNYFNPFKWFNWSSVSTTMSQTNAAIFMTPGLNDNGDSTEGGPSEFQLSFRVKF